MAELKPCPFCGGEAKFFSKCYTSRGVVRGWNFGICCTKCDIALPSTDYILEINLEGNGEIIVKIDEREKATAAWNRRADNG